MNSTEQDQSPSHKPEQLAESSASHSNGKGEPLQRAVSNDNSVAEDDKDLITKNSTLQEKPSLPAVHDGQQSTLGDTGATASKGNSRWPSFLTKIRNAGRAFPAPKRSDTAGSTVYPMHQDSSTTGPPSVVDPHPVSNSAAPHSGDLTQHDQSESHGQA